VPAWVHEAQARVDWLRGRGAAGDEVIWVAERALEGAERHHQVIYAAVARAALAEAMSSRGARGSAAVRAHVREAIEQIQATRTPIYEMEVLHHAARASLGIGDTQDAVRFCQQALARHRGWGDQNLGCLWRVHALRGQLESDPRESARAFMAAGQVVDRLAQPLLRAGGNELAESYLDDPIKVEALTKGPELLIDIKRGNGDE
jgi:hypothetical protein